MGNTHHTVMTTRAPVVLKTNQEKKELTRLLYFEQADLKSHHHRRSQKNTPAMTIYHYYQIGDDNGFNEVDEPTIDNRMNDFTTRAQVAGTSMTHMMNMTITTCITSMRSMRSMMNIKSMTNVTRNRKTSELHLLLLLAAGGK